MKDQEKCFVPILLLQLHNAKCAVLTVTKVMFVSVEQHYVIVLAVSSFPIVQD